MPRIPSRNGHEASTEPSDEVDIKLDRVNELWLRVERKLLRRQPPRNITVVAHSETTGECGEVFRQEFLGIQRDHGKWRLCYAENCTCCDPTDADYEPEIPAHLPWKPITECDLETRMRMSEFVYLVMLEVDNTRTFFIPQLDKAITHLEDALDE